MPAGVELDRGRRLLRQAQGAVQKWPEGFAGFAARVGYGNVAGVEQGEARLVPPSPAAIDGLTGAARRVVERMLGEAANACCPRFFEHGDGRFAVTLEAETAEGERVIRVHTDEVERLEWVLDARGYLRRCEQTVGSVRTATAFEVFMRTTPGRALPTRVRRTRYDATTGAVLGSELIADTFVRIGHVWLPASRRVTASNLGASRTLFVELRDHVLL